MSGDETRDGWREVKDTMREKRRGVAMFAYQMQLLEYFVRLSEVPVKLESWMLTASNLVFVGSVGRVVTRLASSYLAPFVSLLSLYPSIPNSTNTRTIIVRSRLSCPQYLEPRQINYIFPPNPRHQKAQCLQALHGPTSSLQARFTRP